MSSFIDNAECALRQAPELNSGEPERQVSIMIGNSAGFDFGCKVFLTCSDDTEIKSPLLLKQSLKELKLASGNQSRKKRCDPASDGAYKLWRRPPKTAPPQDALGSAPRQRRSNNRETARKHLVRVHEKVVNRRRDWFWKLAHELTDKFDYLFFETLNLKGMQRLWGRKISDLAMKEFLEILYEIEKRMQQIVS